METDRCGFQLPVRRFFRTGHRSNIREGLSKRASIPRPRSIHRWTRMGENFTLRTVPDTLTSR